MKSRRLPFCFLTLLLGTGLLLGGTPVEASQASVLGADNAVYALHEGSMADLFAHDNEANAEDETRILALDVTTAEGVTTRLLVPGTEGDEVESNTGIFFDGSRNLVYLVWESSYESFSPYSRLFLTSYSPQGWSAPIQLTFSAMVEKSSLKLAVTRDRVPQVGEDGELQSLTRTLLHLVWIEDDGSGPDEVVYSPILFLNGDYRRLSEPLVLGDLAPGQTAAAGENYLGDSILSIHRGGDLESVIVVAGVRGTSRLSSWELRVLPGEVSFLAQALHEFILASGNDGPHLSSTALESLETGAMGLLDQLGEHLSDSFLALARAEISNLIRGEPRDVGSLAEDGRLLLIDLGGRLDQEGVRSVTGGGRPQWIPIGARGGPPGHPHQDARSHHVSLRLVEETPVPRILLEHPAEILNSRRGTDFATYWQEGDRLFYQESQAGGWSDAAPIALEGDITAEDAVRLLQERLDNR